MSQALTSGTVLLRSVSIFLSNRRQSKQLKEKAEKGEKKKKGKKLTKMDEQLGKLQPKVLESLKRKTHFNKWVLRLKILKIDFFSLSSSYLWETWWHVQHNSSRKIRSCDWAGKTIDWHGKSFHASTILYLCITCIIKVNWAMSCANCALRLHVCFVHFSNTWHIFGFIEKTGGSFRNLSVIYVHYSGQKKVIRNLFWFYIHVTCKYVSESCKGTSCSWNIYLWNMTNCDVTGNLCQSESQVILFSGASAYICKVIE